MGRGLRHILIIRHGSTELNDHANSSKDKVRGFMDIPLDHRGRLEARKLADKIKENPPDNLVSSDLSRAKETAFTISQQAQIPLALISPAFRPWDLGKYTGELAEKCLSELSGFVNHPDKKVPGAGAFKGESFNDFRHRLFAGLYHVLQHLDGVVGIVTHHRVERLLVAWQAAGYPSNFDIDLKVFEQKGEPPGKAMDFMVPV